MQFWLKKLFDRFKKQDNNFQKKSGDVIGILLVNLGSPDAPTAKGVRKYLGEFLSDTRVVEIPPFVWQPILRGIILRRRPAKVAKTYQKIWTAAGSPLLAISQRLAQGLTELLQKLHTHKTIHVELAMRYGSPSITSGLTALRQNNATKIIILPLYPQYSAATTASTFDAITKTLAQWRYLPEIVFINQYASDPNYIAAIVHSIKTYWQQHGRQDLLLFSFHGLPKASINAGDPYYQQCQLTARLVANALQLPENSWRIVFQSRFGFQQWLQPYCDQTLIELPGEGVTKIDVICPGFAVDCLETLEEIAIRNREIFIAAGGEQLNYIPALNDSSAHLQVLAQLIEKRIS